ncbi:hypothetical protein CDAR_559081 [Caerostris darwini]|uniref:RNase H type-1 domain-containing protein n=1 Tax=Caerostris darwini TaxID=1538125 RepID=A0AAV4TCA5_9ARAC|nr:hypothetical protein CDAR_559081 [Caerostris darwini]
MVPGHVEILGNDRTDVMSKHGAGVSTSTQDRNHITAFINNFPRKSLKDLSCNKRWKCLATEGHIPMHLEHAEAVARFRLTTGHDHQQAHLHHIDLA